MSSGCPWHWRLALTEADLAGGSFRLYSIPAPSFAPYLDSSAESGRSQGGQAIHGFPNADLLWERITTEAAFQIRKFIDAAKSGTGLLYMTIDLNDDSTPGTQWADVRGRPHRDRTQADAGQIVGRRRTGQGSHENYRLLLNNVDILHNPSIFTLE
jgi:hypothetical protein